jgi:hypothetical protein
MIVQKQRTSRLRRPPVVYADVEDREGLAADRDAPNARLSLSVTDPENLLLEVDVIRPAEVAKLVLPQRASDGEHDDRHVPLGVT